MERLVGSPLPCGNCGTPLLDGTEEYESGHRHTEQRCIAALRASLEAAEKGKAEAEANYRFMMERAADQKLDGYREMGARAAAAENERDVYRARVAALEAGLKDDAVPLIEHLLQAAIDHDCVIVTSVHRAALASLRALLRPEGAASPPCSTCGGSKRVARVSTDVIMDSADAVRTSRTTGAVSVRTFASSRPRDPVDSSTDIVADNTKPCPACSASPGAGETKKETP